VAGHQVAASTLGDYFALLDAPAVRARLPTLSSEVRGAECGGVRPGSSGIWLTYGQ
jgi:hypothetical protein